MSKTKQQLIQAPQKAQEALKNSSLTNETDVSVTRLSLLALEVELPRNHGLGTGGKCKDTGNFVFLELLSRLASFEEAFLGKVHGSSWGKGETGGSR